MQKIAIFIILMLFSSEALASHIEVGGIIDSDTTWTADTVRVVDNLTINSNTALTIPAGTVVEFQGWYGVSVLGTVIAKGTETDSILFTSADTTDFDLWEQPDGGWAGFSYSYLISGTDSSIFDFCVFEYGKAYSDATGASGGAFFMEGFSAISLSNSVFRNNSSYSSGGALFIWDATPVLHGLKFYNNTAYRSSGGAIFFRQSPGIVINESQFQENRAMKGGAVYGMNSDDLRIFGCDFLNNTAMNLASLITDYQGGAIYVKNYQWPHNQAEIRNCVINNNSAHGTGGAIYIGDEIDALIENCDISYNWTYNTGAIKHEDNVKLTLINNTLTNNEAHSGAALYYYWNGLGLKLINNLFANNYSTDDYASYNGNGGGAVSIADGSDSVIVYNNTFVNNRHNYMGGAMHIVFTENMKVSNNIFYGNSAPNAPQIAINTKGAAEDSMYFPDLTYNCIQSGQDSIGVYRAYGVVEYDSVYKGLYLNNIENDPRFVAASAGVGSDYDGEDADWSLQSNSWCINSGNPDMTLDSLGTDLDLNGAARIYSMGSTLIIDIGAYEFQGKPTSIDGKEKDLLPTSASLNQNYPNPFNPATAIRYQLPAVTNVQFKVYNTLGQRVQTLVNKRQEAGTYSLVFNGEGLPSGVYFYSLTTDTYTHTRKMILIK